MLAFLLFTSLQVPIYKAIICITCPSNYVSNGSLVIDDVTMGFLRYLDLSMFVSPVLSGAVFASAR